MATLHDDDERLLAQIGYTQNFRRHFNKYSTLSYAVSVLGVLGSVPATFGIPLGYGGPASCIWAWFVGSVMAQIVSSSVSELVSAYPTAGGMYFVTKNVVPPEHAALWSFVIGWANLLGQTAGVASVTYTVSQMILAAISMNSAFDGTSYAFSPTALQTVLLSMVILVIFGIICSLTTSTLHKLVLWFAPINIVASISICIALLVLTPNKQPASWVFGHFIDGSGWGTGFSFLLSFLAVAWTMTDYDGTTHMAEETHDAAIQGPMAIRHAVTISGAIGWMLTVTFCFCTTDLDAIVNSPTGLPAAQIFLNAAGTSGGTVMWFFVVLVQCFTGCSAMLADTRMAYAFARDGALPFSKFWSKVNSVTSTPLHSVWLVVVFSCLLNTIGIGSTQTITAIFNITAPALDISYATVILARNIYSSRIKFVPGPYTLGKWQKPLNWITIVWVFFISVVLLLPTERPITVLNMNYAVVVGAAIAVFSFGWWWAGARNTYSGPKTQDLLEIPPQEDEEVCEDRLEADSNNF
ncbi:amino acid transporter-4 [Coleophoma cylindrospora]|uniref:Amino acid transporter-4 n=1 Tax=Coleophoma cylindrospora TaxID=1849047 RepID=A0A3D8R217_9HELO|nr:amino acid transporter-4 [Coleophoma cylindrospora]